MKARHLAENRLVTNPTSLGLLEVLAKHSLDAMLALDSDGGIVVSNPAAEDLLGRPTEGLPGASLADVFEIDAARIEGLMRTVADGADVAGCDIRVPRTDGETLTVEVEARGLAPHFEGCVLYLREPAPPGRSDSELLRANEALEHCVNALAHDLRSPLVALLGFSRLLRQDYDEKLDETGRHFLDRIEQAGRTMESLIHDLLELSRIEAPTEVTQLVDPLTVLLQLKAELKPTLEAEGIELVLPESPLPLIACEGIRIYQVFSNLIGNAIEHMGREDSDSREIRVEVREHADRHELVVIDNGRGIAEEHHELIFEVFRSLSGRRRGRKGAGFGLAIVRRIAETYGGSAWVESEVGRGAAFHVALPQPEVA